MKKILPLIMILLAVCAVFAASVAYRSDKYGSVNDDSAAVTENQSSTGENRLIAENK